MSDTRKLAESVRRWREQSGECGWTDDRVAACVSAHLQPAPSDAWKNAVEEACIVSFIDFYPDDPKRSLANLISWEVKIALDPAVSEEAAKLVEQGRAASKPAPTEGPNDVIENWWKRWCAADENQGLQTVSGPMTTVENALEFAQWYAGHQLAARPSELSAEPDNGWARKAAEELDDEFDIMPSKTVISSEEQGERLEEVAAIIRKWATTSSTSAAAKENHEKV